MDNATGYRVMDMRTDDILARRTRRQRKTAIIAVVLFGLVVWSVDVTVIQDTDWARIGSLGEVMEAAGQFAGIDFSLFPSLLGPTLETLLIACLGTAMGVILCVPATWFGAMNITPFAPITYPIARLMMTLSRSVHEIVWALFFVAVFGLGAMAGVFAIAMRSIGFIAKLSAEAIEDIDPGPVEAMRATGANTFQVMLYAIMPQVLPQVIGTVIFEWEINIRRSAVLGLVGAGGLGLVFFRQMNTFNFHGVTSVIIAILAIIFLGEAISHAIRRRMI
ncbi:MAG TPA: phosphonate ABC transporter, permease protein PhnE [Rhodospirillaceae bacterium]|nr:phosphonate ABC transporter, permease protein PhnE [Rhodospirillaceae bacterium]|tara:strand:- start:224 stop:1054 length:831 start_codon:yes stop_codon:yes gene_type:complete